jgi:hypothetical protein
VACTASEEVPAAELADDTPKTSLGAVRPALGREWAAAWVPPLATPGSLEVPCRDPKKQQPQPPKELPQVQPVRPQASPKTPREALEAAQPRPSPRMNRTRRRLARRSAAALVLDMARMTVTMRV